MVITISQTLAPGPGTVPSTLLGEMRYKDPAVPVPSELYLPPKQATPLFFLYSSPSAARGSSGQGEPQQPEKELL